MDVFDIVDALVQGHVTPPETRTLRQRFFEEGVALDGSYDPDAGAPRTQFRAARERAGMKARLTRAHTPSIYDLRDVLLVLLERW